MTLGLAFWIIMLIWLIVGGLTHSGVLGVPWASTLLLFVLFGLLGWAVFGAPLHK